MTRRLFVSFSGGETSALMTRLILANWSQRYDDIRIGFANTGEEDERTLMFVRNCDRAFGFRTTWVEAVVHHGERKSPTHKIVSFETASRRGEPFEEAVRKYGVPNMGFPHCTRSLKTSPMESLIRSWGWKKGSYHTAIGIRSDEIDRMSAEQDKLNIIYPLISEWPTTKPQVNDFWAQQPFRLGLKGYEGNCVWCWKKSLRKHLTLLDERPMAFEFPERLERLYGTIGPEFSKDEKPVYDRRVLFRERRSVWGLRALAMMGGYDPAPDDNAPRVPFDPALDVGGGCEESCEVDFGDMEGEEHE